MTRCSCGRPFRPRRPEHKRCYTCHRSALIAEEQRHESAAAEQELRGALVQAYLAGNLPKSARVTARGSQLIVVWQGKSRTLYLPSRAA